MKEMWRTEVLERAPVRKSWMTQTTALHVTGSEQNSSQAHLGLSILAKGPG